MSNTEEDAQIRKEWRTNSHVQIYSNSKRKWFVGEVAQIFHDAEGEWLEIRYDKSMSKQVQRFSTDIKPTEEQVQELKQRLAKEKAEKEAAPFPEKEMTVRAAWTKGHKVEIFSNTHQEWHVGEVTEIMKDEEGEWLNVVWHRDNGEAVSKQVQRFSTDVRPVQNETTKEPEEKKINPQSLEDEIKQRKQGFKRRAPPFARTCTGVLWQYPATQRFRRAKKLDNVEETEKEEEELTEISIEEWSAEQVCEWLKSLGSIYEKYIPKFRTIRGIKLKQMNEDNFVAMSLPKLHAVKLAFEIQKLLNKSIAKETMGIDVLSWSSADVTKWAQKQLPLNQYASKFVSHGIDGVILFELDAEDLATIGVRPSHCDKILEIIHDLSKQTFPDFIATEENNKLKNTSTNSSIGNKTDNKNSNSASDSLNKDKAKNNDNGIINDKKESDMINHNNHNHNHDEHQSKHKRRQSVMHVEEMNTMDTPMYLQVLKEMLDLLSAVSGELTNEKIKTQAHLVQEKIHIMLNQMDPTYTMKNIIIPKEKSENKEESNSNATKNTPTGKNSPFAEVEGKPIAGIPLSYVNTLEQKRGHRHRSSLPFVNQPYQEYQDDEDEDMSDIE